MGIRAGIGFRHWNRVEGSKCAHCLQQCSGDPHLGQFPFQSRSEGSVVEQLKHRAATTFCKSLGKRGPVTSIGGRGPEGFGRSAGRRSPDPLFESMYPRCLYLRSSSMCLIDSWILCLRTTADLGGVHHKLVPRLSVGSFGGFLREPARQPGEDESRSRLICMYHEIRSEATET
jgi:hypothetical protein